MEEAIVLRVFRALTEWMLSALKLMARTAGNPRYAPIAVGGAAFLALFLFSLPEPLFNPSYSLAVYDRTGRLLGARVAEDGQWRFPPSGEVPERFGIALSEFEDGRFFGHAGFDVPAIVRAVWLNARAGKIVSGASTISMQCARLSRESARLGRETRKRTFIEKLTELSLAVRIELSFSKRRIISLYAAHAPFGGNIVGLEAACRRYFGRPPDRLTWAEASLLAVLPNSPSLAHPGRNREALLAKRNALLGRLAARGAFDASELALALAEPLPEKPHPVPALTPHLLDRISADRSGTGNARFVSTIDAVLQERVNAVMTRQALRLQDFGISNAACVICSVDSMEVLAYVGNATADGAQAWVDCAAAPRSSGSVLKPFLYAAMLNSGEITPSMLVADIPTRVGSFSPENFHKTYSGAVSARDALARSLNIPFVRLLRGFGVERFHRLLVDSGFSTMTRPAQDYGLTLILGGSEINLYELAGAYSVFARSAKGLETGSGGTSPRMRYGVSAGPGNGVNAPWSRAAAYLTLQALLEVKRPEEESAWQDFASSRRIAWKTGTSQGMRDAWSVGVTADYVVAVWAGNATGEGRPALRGAAAAAPMLFDLFQLLPAGPWFNDPGEELAWRTLCARSGYLSGDDCARVVRERVPAVAKSPELCPFCKSVLLSEDGKWRVSANDAQSGKPRREKRFVLPPALEWWFRRSQVDYRPLPPWKPGSSGGSDDDMMSIIIPESGSRFYVPVELDGSDGMVVFKAVHRDSQARLFWHLDGNYLGETKGDHRIELRPGQGSHSLTVVDEAGRSLVRGFEILNER